MLVVRGLVLTRLDVSDHCPCRALQSEACVANPSGAPCSELRVHNPPSVNKCEAVKLYFLSDALPQRAYLVLISPLRRSRLSHAARSSPITEAESPFAFDCHARAALRGAAAVPVCQPCSTCTMSAMGGVRTVLIIPRD